MHQSKKVWIFVFLFFSFIDIGYADGLNITNPQENYFYTVGVLDLDLQIGGSGYTNCWYEVNYTPQKYPILCKATGNKVNILKDGSINLSVHFNKTGTIYNDSVVFSVDRDLSTGKGYLLFGLMLFPFAIIFTLLYFGTKFGQEHKPLKYFLYFSALTFVFVSHLVNMYIIENFIHATPLMEVFNTRVYGWIYFIILAYFMIYWTYSLFVHVQNQKKKKLEY